ncbi:MAG: leucine--tRNA ligase [Myxococcota bacterium]|nr:leucine--tRNA ligase [Myxococcota bacterium]
MPYDPAQIEPRWQAYWLENESFRSEIDESRPKYYVLDMFPYPSGDGLHVGHALQMTATDILARYKRLRGFNVLHPMGWDAFGLLAEQFAIKTGTHPRETTQQNIDNFRRQIRSLGCSYDWSREINTTDPGYVKWTQWIFRKLFELGLAYRAEVPVNWCPTLGTVLSNEEVIDGKSEVGGHPVERLPLTQWMLRITDYAERLLTDLDDLDWPEPIKKMQRDWIGRSEGARIRFEIAGHPETPVEVFTTRPDTLFGATYMVLAPEHPLVATITTDERRSAVTTYVETTRRKSERARLIDGPDKTGVATGAQARNPATGQEIPIWIADYVLAGYGTGAIMAVPGHDQRDYEFAKAFDLPVIEVVEGGDLDAEAFTGPGVAVRSGFLDGLPSDQAVTRMNEWLESEELGEATVSYKLRDWLFSRQRYWGEPFPVIHREDGSISLIPETDLPLTLPELQDFRPTGDFSAPLARMPEWIQTKDPESGMPAVRDTNTMPQWAGSCWYFLRFTDPNNSDEAWSEAAERYWMPVDFYMGGAEHAVLHLLYARFWHKVFYDVGLVHTVEPFKKLVNQGMILGSSYRYYDDNLADTPEVETRNYSAERVTVEGERTVADDGRELKTRWLQPKDISRDREGRAIHPDFPELALEEVVEKMSKSRGNVINPDEVIERFGADSMRLYEMFIGPVEKSAPWSTDGIQGVRRFLDRSWRLLVQEDASGNETLRTLGEEASEAEARLLAQTISGVTDDFEALRFNTAISKLMVFVRDVAGETRLSRTSAEALVLMLSPRAPHIAEELWSRLGHEQSLVHEKWPEADPEKLREDSVTLVVQVNGKRRGEIEVSTEASEDALRETALAVEAVQKHLEGRSPKKVIVVPGRLVNVVG